MPTWGVTGKLGGGKTLYAVFKARERIGQGVRVATNVDLFPEKFCRSWRNEDSVRVYRLPDRPSRRDLDALGVGNESSDETKNGLLILDECGNILNSRTYRDDDRQELIEWFLHARKLGWDIMFIVQNISLIDKQIRDSLIEYKVICKRFDRLNLPGLSWIGIKVRLPRLHFAIVKYGLEAHAVTADREFFRGNDLFAAYNTRQVLYSKPDDDAEKQKAVRKKFKEQHGIEMPDITPTHLGVSSVLPPWHIKGRYMKKWELIRAYARGALLAGIVIGLGLTWLAFTALGYKRIPMEQTNKAEAVADISGVVLNPDGSALLVTKDGKSHRVREYSIDAKGLFARLDDGKFHQMERTTK
ncbi:MAG: zonular occludens toxin domain-containing protein [Desulfuromonas thiophila]|nr:zonular occludens toxin domain-containing protein [Desulfuromonas thiophila]